MSATDADGAELKYETRLLRLLKSADVNTLAEEHLAGGFSGMVSTYVERVREARAAEANYAAAVRDADRIYGASIEETKKWANMSKQQRETEISRLKKELSSLESQRKRLLKDYKDVCDCRRVARGLVVGYGDAVDAGLGRPPRDFGGRHLEARARTQAAVDVEIESHDGNYSKHATILVYFEAP